MYEIIVCQMYGKWLRNIKAGQINKKKIVKNATALHIYYIETIETHQFIIWSYDLYDISIYK